MKKIAIVGVEGSGKTVMMAAMGEQWERPDERGYFLSPENAEAFGFSKSVMSILRSGKWPSASSHDEMRHLDWSLQRRQGGSLEKIADISMLDYAGEVYRQAFGGEKKEGYDTQVATLRSHVDEADVLIVLVNLSDIINGSMQNRRTRDAMWLTKSVLDCALGEARSHKPQTAIVFTQADGYHEIIAANGGPVGTLRQYLPHVANLYGGLPIFMAAAIDRTVVGDDGLPIPAPGFKSTGLKELMEWAIDDCQKTLDHKRLVEKECDACAMKRRQYAINLFKNKKYKEAFTATKEEYSDGDYELAYQLAYMYRFGKGTEKSPGDAADLIERIERSGANVNTRALHDMLTLHLSERLSFAWVALGTFVLLGLGCHIVTFIGVFIVALPVELIFGRESGDVAATVVKILWGGLVGLSGVAIWIYGIVDEVRKSFPSFYKRFRAGKGESYTCTTCKTTFIGRRAKCPRCGTKLSYK